MQLVCFFSFRESLESKKSNMPFSSCFILSFQVEKSSTTSRADSLIYPPLPPKPSTPSTDTPLTSFSSVITPVSSRPSTPDHPSPKLSPKTPVVKSASPSQPVAGVSVRPPSVALRSPAHNPALAPRLTPCPSLVSSANSGPLLTNQNRNKPTLAPTWTTTPNTHAFPLLPPPMPGPDILPLLKVTFFPSSNPAPHPAPQVSTSVMSADVRQKLKELLSKNSHGLWAHGLPKLFMDTFKTPFPDHILSNLSLLLDICDVEYPVPGDKTKVCTVGKRTEQTH